MTPQENEARQLLNDADLAPPRVDLTEVMRQGRRQRTRRHLVGVTGGMALAVTLTAAVAVPIAMHGSGAATTHTSADLPLLAASTASGKPAVTTCPVSPLPLPPGISNVVVNVQDSSGRYAAGYGGSSTPYRTVFWADGQPRILSLPGSQPSVDAINAQGVLVGETSIGGNHAEHVFRDVDNTSTILQYPVTGAWHPYSVYLNDRGDIIANAEPAGNSGGEGAITLLWKAGSDTAVRLPLPERSEVFGITNDGIIFGDMLGGNAYTWDSTGHHGRQLPLPAGSNSSIAGSVSVTGDIATGSARPVSATPSESGSAATDPHSQPTPFSVSVLWNLRTGAVSTPLRPSTNNKLADRILSVNASGSAVISSVSKSGVRSFDPGKYLRADGTVATLLPVKVGYAVQATATGDNGVVVGNSTGPAPLNESVPTEWHC